jgi:hypothetical protein
MILTRILETVHGHAGILATAGLIHPALLLRRGQQLSRGSRIAVVLATLFAVLAFSLGIVIYEDYRSVVKRSLFRASFNAGLRFETKEHLAYAVVMLALSGAVCALVAPRESRRLRQAAAATYLTAALLSGLVCVLGTYVSAVHGFPE